MNALPISSAQFVPVSLNSSDNLTNYTGHQGELLHFFGQTIKTWDSDSKQHVYYSKNHLAEKLAGQNCSLSKINRITEKILEIINPYTRDTVNTADLKKCYEQVGQQNSFESALNKLEAIKNQNPLFNQLYYEKNISEVGEELQAGDIIIRKYHEDNPNPICDLQKLFRRPDFRESYKHSHLAIYLGKNSKGKHWVAEATLPHGNEPQIRRLQLDDERFALKDKNQYVVIRNQDSEVARETASMAKRYAVKMLPKAESPSVQDDGNTGYKYNHFDALRSLWHSHKFDFFAKQRVFKYYSDHSNKVPFQYITDKRNMYCSQFAFLSIQMAEAEKSEVFQDIIKNNPPPVSNENKYKNGIAKFFARISYVVRRAFWARSMTFKYSGKMDEAFKTRVDFLRTSPQDAVNHLLVNNRHYKVVGVINKQKST